MFLDQIFIFGAILFGLPRRVDRRLDGGYTRLKYMCKSNN